MAEEIISTQLTSELAELLMCESIEPGSDVGYRICKIIWEFHPLGGKMVEKPIIMAMYKPRVYNLDNDPGDLAIKRFNETWKRLNITEKIKNLFFNARCFGAAAIGVGESGKSSKEQITLSGIKESDIFINIFDPLTAAGSMVTSQDPNSENFQRPDKNLNIQGTEWHSSRTMKVFNGAPIYLSWQQSSFGFCGRSVFQRVLYPLKSFINTMITDDLVSEKAGVLVAKVAGNSSVITRIAGMANKERRQMVKAAKSKGVINIGPQDDITSLNLQNIDGAMNASRNNIIANISAGSDVPAQILKDEAFANGFGEGKEDSKSVAQYIDSIRQQIDPVMGFFENIVQYVAWNEDFWQSVRNTYPEIYTGSYEETFTAWKNSFSASWVDLQEQAPEKRQEADAKLIENTTKVYERLAPSVDPENRAIMVEWVASVINALESWEGSPLVIDADALKNYVPPKPVKVISNDDEKEGEEA